ncbi:hypothetical protein [Hyphomicrobium sp.]|uniref:hypothetical protein n=1 Tax=Hyphomicrobium sp. TaxID=82 RepID=UPI000F97D5D0|nr:hypothetical protein [Hyphomicrobium sp.]RUP11142.1 MAG: hypothetical protein EKK38_01430 [Hyphomicrobium sp.]
MGDKATFEALLNAAVFVAPVALLLTLFALLLHRRLKRSSAKSSQASRSVVGIAAPISPAGKDAAVAEPPPKLEDVETLNKKIELALARGEKTALSRLYYDLAAGHERLGNVEARMSALRSAAGYGALHGPGAAHAAARIALGEAAQQAGDLTTACEQWQMAKAAYLEAGDTDQQERVEKRMRENGCPTDWVLTDF